MKIMDFSQANCKNCYKCVRNCSVKAIRIINDQAQIDEKRCIACGDCFVVCPQNARNIVSDLENVKSKILGKTKVIASIAPSYMGIYKYPKKLISGLYQLGFDVVEETAIGADIVTSLYKKHIQSSNKLNLITSCCPSINLLIEHYYPELIDFLIPVDSPMIVHRKMLRQKYGSDSIITFIGPCISKKIESLSYYDTDAFDYVLTFDEIDQWLLSRNIIIDNLPDTIQTITPSTIGSNYPVEYGILKNLESVISDCYIPIKASGLSSCKDLFQSMIDGTISGVILEANSCIGSCIGGPGVSHEKLHKHESYIQLNKKLKDRLFFKDDCYFFNNVDISFEKIFVNKKVALPTPSESELRSILEKLGKHSLDDELNCGACGYDTCRDKAIAVFRGMSHKEMCIPYMRTRAERMTNTIFNNSPNIIIILDENFCVLEFNPTAEKLFSIKAKQMVGQHINLLINDDDFINVHNNDQNMISKKVYYEKYDLVVMLNIMYLPKQNLYMCIMHNITDEEKRTKELLLLKERTLNAAQNVIDKQMRVAQEIASLLGETTAETKVTLTRLQKIVRGEEGEIK